MTCTITLLGEAIEEITRRKQAAADDRLTADWPDATTTVSEREKVCAEIIRYLQTLDTTDADLEVP